MASNRLTTPRRADEGYTENGQTVVSGVVITGNFAIPNMSNKVNSDPNLVRQVAITHEGVHATPAEVTLRGPLSLSDFDRDHQDPYNHGAARLLGLE